MGLKSYVKFHTWMLDLRMRSSESGASAVEYGLLLAMIAGVIVAVVTVLGKKVSNGFSSMNAQLP